MTNTGRWIYCPMTSKRLGRRVTLADRFRRWRAQRNRGRIDVYMVTGFFDR